MPHYLRFHLPDPLFILWQRKSIILWYRGVMMWMWSLSQKLFQGIHILRSDDISCQHIPIILYICKFYSAKFHQSLLKHLEVETLQKSRLLNDVYLKWAFQSIIHRAVLGMVCVCVWYFLPLGIRFISFLFITITHPSMVSWIPSCGTLHSITLHSSDCSRNSPLTLRTYKLLDLLSLRLHLSVIDRANTRKQTAGQASNKISCC